MKPQTLLNLMLAGGVGVTIGGILTTILLGKIWWLYGVTGLLLTGFGLAWTAKVRKIQGKRLSLTSKQRMLILLFLAMAFTTRLVLAQGSETEWCLTMYRRVLYVEYVILGLTLISGLLAFAPVLFGRTILGPILHELQSLAGGMLIILIFMVLMVYPLHVMFNVVGEGDNLTCTIDPTQLQTNGPPLLRIILKLISPPELTP